MSRTVGFLLAEATAQLEQAGLTDPAREARLLLAHTIGAAALFDRDRLIPADPVRRLVARRAAREPAALILGRQGFWTLDLAVSPDTLIPRPDSETLVEAALAAFPDRAAPLRVLDLGTGTGCLLLAVLSERPNAWGLGIDRVPAACRLAAANAAANDLAGRARFVAADWAGALDARFDLVLSNPPYIRTPDLAGLMPEIARHEPATALDGGADGLAAYRSLTERLASLLAPSGRAILELGQGQAPAVGALMRSVGLETACLHDDLAGIPRALTLRAAGEGEKTFGKPCRLG